MTQPWGPWPPDGNGTPPGPPAYTPAQPADWSPAPTNTSGALDQLAERASTDLYLDTGAAEEGNVFNTWASLWGRVLNTLGRIRIWVVDSALTIPLGDYYFDAVADRTIELSAANLTNSLSLSFATGARFHNGPIVCRNVIYNGNDDQPCIIISANTGMFATDVQFLRGPGLSQPVVRVIGPAALVLHIDGANFIARPDTPGDAVFEIATAALDGTLVLQAVGSGQYVLDDNCVEGFAGFGALVLLTSPSASFSQTQGGLTNPPTFSQLSAATGVAYSPTVPANWTAPPDEVGEALDALAARAVATVVPFVQQTVLAANKSTVNTTNPPSVDKLLTHNITLPAGYSKLLIRAMAHCTGANNERIYLAIYVDGVIKARDWIFTDLTSTDGESNFEVLVTGVAVGARVIDLYWSVTAAGNAVCNPVATPETYRCTITVQAFA